MTCNYNLSDEDSMEQQCHNHTHSQRRWTPHTLHTSNVCEAHSLRDCMYQCLRVVIKLLFNGNDISIHLGSKNDKRKKKKRDLYTVMLYGFNSLMVYSFFFPSFSISFMATRAETETECRHIEWGTRDKYQE